MSPEEVLALSCQTATTYTSLPVRTLHCKYCNLMCPVDPPPQMFWGKATVPLHLHGLEPLRPARHPPSGVGRGTWNFVAVVPAGNGYCGPGVAFLGLGNVSFRPGGIQDYHYIFR
jgi:hypothetical protein